jgi:hypothetical protein
MSKNAALFVVRGKLFQFRTKHTTVYFEEGKFVIRASYNLAIKLGTIHHVSTGKRGDTNWRIVPRFDQNKTAYFHCPLGGLPSSAQIDRLFRGPLHLYNNHRQAKVEKKKRLPQRTR